jgi:hypothetical protein
MSTTLEATATAAVEIEWVTFPFTYAGKSFNSKVKAKTRKLRDIEALPAGVFNSMNEAALRDLATITASTSREEDTAELERLNAGASWAVLELAGE